MDNKEKMFLDDFFKGEATVTLDLFKKYAHEQRMVKLYLKSKEFIDFFKKDVGQQYVDFIGITLTYRDMDTFWQSVEAGGIRQFLMTYNVYLKRKNIKVYGYFWFLEFQVRGVPHYHLVYAVPKGTKLPFPDKRNWKYGSTRTERINPSKAYVYKYASKMAQKDYRLFQKLKGLRMYTFAISKDFPVLKARLQSINLNSYLRELKKIFNVIKVKYQYNKGGISWYSFFVDAIKIKIRSLKRFIFSKKDVKFFIPNNHYAVNLGGGAIMACKDFQHVVDFIKSYLQDSCPF